MRKKVEMDSRRSWVVAFSCCFINCLMYGVARLSGMLMIATLETFHISRASAALPFSVSTSVRNLSGLYAGNLEQRFGLSFIIASGSILASLGACLCFFATDYMWIIVCWGGILGMGFGLSTCLLPLAINQQFDKYRGTASGISYSGSYVGSFIFPPLVAELLNIYGLQGTFAVIGATFLNGLAISLLFRAPSSEEKINDNNDQIMIEHRCIKPNLNGNKNKKIWLRLWYKTKSKFSIFKNKLQQKTASETSLIFNDHSKYTKSDLSNCELIAYTDYSFMQINPSNTLDLFQIQRFPLVDRKLSTYKLKSFNLKTQSKTTRLNKKITKLKHLFEKKLVTRRYSLKNNSEIYPTENIKLSSYTQVTLPYYFTKDISKVRSEIEIINKQLLLNKSLSRYKNNNPNGSFHKESKIRPQCDKVQKQMITQDSVNTIPTHHCDQINEYHQAYPLQIISLSEIPHSDKLNTIYDPEIYCTKPKDSALKGSFRCLFGWFRLYGEPMFVVIAITMALHTLVMVCMITIIEDYAKDIGIPPCQAHYVLMILSTADLVGSLTLGIITDKRLLSRSNFIMVCFLGMSITQFFLARARSSTSLLSLVATYGVFESGVIITLPLLIDLFIPKKKQAVAVASSNFLSSPSVLLVPLIIGHFRDQRGCYSGAFYFLGITSLFSCVLWFAAPKINSKFQKKKIPFHIH